MPWPRTPAASWGATWLIYGTLVKVGEALSLEGRLLDITGQAAPATVKLQATGLQALTGLSRQMGQELSLKILGKVRIAHIMVKGNRRIEKDAILGVMYRPGGEDGQCRPPPGGFEGHL